MPRLRRNGGIGQLEPREGAWTLMVPEIASGSTPTGTREHAEGSGSRAMRPERIRNGVPLGFAYDPSAEARAIRARSRKYAAARRALELAAQRYGPPPMTIRGLPRSRALPQPKGRRRAAAA